MAETFSEAEVLRGSKTSRIELFKYPGIRSKDPPLIKRVVETSPNLRLSDILEENSGVGNNKLFYIVKDESALPEACVKVFDVSAPRGDKRPYEREVSALKLFTANKHLLIPQQIIPPEFISENGGYSLVMSYVPDNVDKTPEVTLSATLSALEAINSIKPTEKNKEIFPYSNLNNLENPDSYFEETVLSRVRLFNEWVEGLGEEGEEVSLDSVDETSLLKEIKKSQLQLGIQEKIGNIREEMKGRTLVEESDVCFTLGDGNLSNIRLFYDNGELTIHPIDFEATEFGSRLLQVALLVNHPANRKIFDSDDERVEYMARFIGQYANRTNLSHSERERLAFLISYTDLSWIATAARNFVTGYRNIREAHGGNYRNRAQYLLETQVPLLQDMVNSDPQRLLKYLFDSEDKVPKLESKGQIRTIESSLNGLPAITKYQRWVGEKVKEMGNIHDWVERINDPLKSHDPSYLFSAKEVALMGEPYLLGETKKVKQLGEGYFLTINKISSIRKPGVEGSYGFLTRSKEQDSSKGGLMFITGSEEISSSPTEPIKVTQEVLQALREKIKPGFEGRFKVFLQTLSKLEKVESSVSVKSFEIIDDMDRFYSLVLAKLNNGQTLTIKVNREDRTEVDMGGVQYVPRTKEGKYLLVRQKRVPIPVEGVKKIKSKETLEAARGWIDPTEHPMEELAQELGLKAGYTLQEAASVQQDYRTDSVAVTVYFVNVDKKRHQDQFSQGLDTDEYGEEILTEELSGKEIIDAIKEGVIRDNYSIYDFCLYMLRTTNELEIDDRLAENKNVYLQKKFILQAGDFKWCIPEGSKGTGTLLAETLSDSSSARWVDEVNEVDLDDAEVSKIEGLESVSIKQAIDNIRDGVYDGPTGASLLLGFLKKGYLKYKGL